MDTFNKTLLVCWFAIFTTSMGLSQLAPILPLYIRSLGVSEYESVAFYSGLSFGITSLFMAAFSPIWGALTLRFGCKIMLLRASFGMAVLTLTLAFVQNVEQIVIIRALTGVISGFTSSAIVYIALISPAQKAGASLATLSTASVSGNLIGPLFGGVFSDFIGIRALFIVIAGLLFCSFFTIYFFIHEQKGQIKEQIAEEKGFKNNISLILILFCLTFIIQLGFTAVVPIMTLFVEQIHHNNSYIALWTGIVVAASGLSNLIFASKLGKIADKIGASKVLILALCFSGVIFYLQALVQDIFTLIILRLLLGIGLGGLLPCINALFKKNVSTAKLGLVFGFNQSAFSLGNFFGSVGGGYLAGYFSIEFVFISACCVFVASALFFAFIERKTVFKI